MKGQTPLQLMNYYEHQKERCFEIYGALERSYAPENRLEEVQELITFNNCMIRLYAFVIRMNKAGEYRSET